MTIALIGKEDSIRAAARIGLVSPQGAEGFNHRVERAGHQLTTASDWSEMLESAIAQPVDVVFCHHSMRGGVPAGFRAPVLCVDDDVEISDGALQGMFDLAVQLAGQSARLVELEGVVEGIRSGDAIVGNTPVIRRLKSAVSRAAECDATVLIEGPSGAGKSLAARVIHLKSRRADSPIMVKECSTVSADEMTSLLNSCAATTLVLEDVDQLPSNAQSVLVKHLKERSSARAPATQVRIIATTAAHIPELVARGAFREDLFYRLHTFPIMVPGLHERVDDVQALADAILDVNLSESGRGHAGFTAGARALLESMHWPGHVAQLETVIRRGQALAAGGAIDREHLLAQPSSPKVASESSSSAQTEARPSDAELTEESIRPFEEEEKHLLGRALQATKGNVRRAAQLLGIGRATLYRKIQQYHLRLH